MKKVPPPPTASTTATAPIRSGSFFFGAGAAAASSVDSAFSSSSSAMRHFPPRGVTACRLLTELHELREQLVGGADRARVRLERALRQDQIDELASEIRVG